MKKILIATMPKSGTWYCHCFFHCYGAWLSFRRPSLGAFLRRDRFCRVWQRPDLIEALRNNAITPITHPKRLGVHTLYICHSICPGYRQVDDPRRRAWEGLRFYVEGYNYGEGLEDFDRALNPARAKAAKVIYLFRNPLDQMVSYWRHAQRHVDSRHLRKTDAAGNVSPIADFRDFVFNGSGLDSYIKQYHTFRAVHDRYPENVLLVSYEELVAKPEKWFARMLRFMGHEIKGPRRLYCFQQALRMTTKEAIIDAENALGRCLAHDQTDALERHVRDGKVGKWREWFTEADIELVKERLACFGLCFRQEASSWNMLLHSHDDVQESSQRRMLG